MPRRRGFRTEDYALAQRIEEVLNLPVGTAVPSKVCDAAETWALTKLRARAKLMWDKGWHDEARTLYTTCALLEEGTL